MISGRAGVFMSNNNLVISDVCEPGRNMHRPAAQNAPEDTPSEDVDYTEIGVD